MKLFAKSFFPFTVFFIAFLYSLKSLLMMENPLTVNHKVTTFHNSVSDTEVSKSYITKSQWNNRFSSVITLFTAHSFVVSFISCSYAINSKPFITYVSSETCFKPLQSVVVVHTFT